MDALAKLQALYTKRDELNNQIQQIADLLGVTTEEPPKQKGAVAGLVGIEVGVVSGEFNLESPGVSALGWRLRHEEAYHSS